jgi:hypothetical protein
MGIEEFKDQNHRTEDVSHSVRLRAPTFAKATVGPEPNMVQGGQACLRKPPALRLRRSRGFERASLPTLFFCERKELAIQTLSSVMLDSS